MDNVNELCFSCMRKKGSGSICQACGFDSGAYSSPLHHLKPGTILAGKYIVGKALGEGGFGITYIGYDINLEMRVAIKEYFPNGFVSRDVSNTDTVTIFSGSGQEAYEQGKNKFINEAKALAKFDNMPGIVSVKDFFLENGTAYIVMEYVEGETLKSFLQRNGGKTGTENILEMMKPLMKSLAQVHKKGIIHRDISPDNIMITDDSRVKLLDFGAARDISADGQKSLSIQLKPGYAPEEQYRSHGKQGPWTDVYALCATIYRAITGIQPMEALERLQNDALATPSQIGIAINASQESAIMRGMAVFANQRFQDMEALYNALYGGATVGETGQTASAENIPSNSASGKSSKTVIAVIAACAAVVICCVCALVAVMGNTKSDDPPQPSQTPVATQEVNIVYVTPDPPENQQALATYYVVNCKQYITLRTEPSTSAAEILKIPLGQPVGFIEAAGNGFYKISYNGQTGYALAAYLSDDVNTSNGAAKVVNAKDFITLRTAPSTSASEITKIPADAFVTYICESTNGFCMIEYDGMRGYALASYIEIQ